ncbi:hypothetical protein Dimus_028764 [Dionaea muscipula]
MAQAVLVAEPKAMESLVKDAEKLSLSTNVNGKAPDHKKNRIQVSNTKKPLFFYLNLAKRYIKQHNDVELSALGMAIPTLVTIVEILKSKGLVVEKKVLTSTIGSKNENKGRLVQKAKLEIVLEKSENPKKHGSQNESESNPSGTESIPAEAESIPAEAESMADADKEE